MGFSQIKVGDVAPTFFTRTLDGEDFFLSKTINDSSLVVFSFFATWCVSCTREIPLLDSLQNELPNVKIYLVNAGNMKIEDEIRKEDPKKVTKFIKNLNVNLPVLTDKFGLVAKKYATTVLPKLVVIDSKGKITYLKTGFKNGDEKEIIEHLKLKILTGQVED